MIWGSGGSKSRLAKAAGAEPAEGFGAVLEVEMLKSARRCGAKHISKTKCTKHTRSEALLEVEMSKKCTPLWREARFQVKMLRTPHARITFYLRFRFVFAWRAQGILHLSKNEQNVRILLHFQKRWQACDI